MQAHIVLAHPEPRSFNAHLADVARKALTAQGWGVTLSDLYAMGFDPCEGPAHYPDRLDPDRFDTQSQQRHAAAAGTLPPEVAAEIARLDAADLVVLQYPMWWHPPPAMLKGWFDRVFAYGAVYRSDHRFESGRFIGKRALLSPTVGTSRETYAFDGRSGDIDLMLWPVNFTLAYAGFGICAPQIAYGVEAGLRYSDPAVIGARLAGIAGDHAARLAGIMAEPLIPFNRMADWGPDGRIRPGAPVYSPYIRRREHLQIE